MGATQARNQVNDAAYTVLASDRTVAVTALTAARVLTLPAASAYPQGATLTVVDESGACSAVNTVTLARASSSDAINGGAPAVLATPYGYLALESNGSNKWTIVDQPSGAVSALNGGPLAGFRNRVMNGNFAVNQRGQASNSALSAGAYGHDRWKAGANGCTYTFAAATPDTAITVTAGSLQQTVETVHVEGGVYAMSWTGTATARATYTAAGASTTTTTAFAASPIVLPGVNAGLAVTVKFGTGTVGAVQLEPGPIATPFERRPVSIETALCQRYFQMNGGAVASIISGSGSYYINAGFTFPVTMRAVPTLMLVKGAGAVDQPNVASLNITGFTTTYSPPGVFGPGLNGVLVQLVCNATSTGLCEVYLNVIGFSAEL